MISWDIRGVFILHRLNGNKIISQAPLTHPKWICVSSTWPRHDEVKDEEKFNFEHFWTWLECKIVQKWLKRYEIPSL